MTRKIKFPENNIIDFGQDFSFRRGVPWDVEFEIVEEGMFPSDSEYILRAPGYGGKPYGNGCIYVKKEIVDDLFQKKIVEVTMRCEGWRRYGGAFSFGPVKWEQCKNEAIVMLELKQDGKIEKLPGCMTCWQEAINTKAIEIISVVPIEKVTNECK